VGSMCIIKPFHVNPVPFLRDVGFFSLAVGLVFYILIDGLVEAWEAGILVGLYACYVVVVAGSAWWEGRRDRRNLALQEGHRAFDREPLPSIAIYEPYQDDREQVSYSPRLWI
jgi:sodium/potassium/calcium exchanger 6